MKINISEKLEQKNMSRYELAKRVGVTYPTITAIYNGESTSIKLDILEAICSELECTPDEILVPESDTLQRLMAYNEACTKLIAKINKGDSK